MDVFFSQKAAEVLGRNPNSPPATALRRELWKVRVRHDRWSALMGQYDRRSALMGQQSGRQVSRSVVFSGVPTDARRPPAG